VLYYKYPSQLKPVNKVTNYFKDSYKELMEKVTWPTWSELQQSTVIVLVATILITLLVGVMDVFSNGILKFIYSLLS
jgi:preprotein translocase subunit SecE